MAVSKKAEPSVQQNVENKLKSIRPLMSSEIECRVGTMKPDGSGCSLLLYKDARVDMRILDEVFGPMNWRRSHDVVNGNLFCTISIWDGEKKEWVSKQDVGTESYTEKEKGQASDAFKRAGFNWGIGRELYTGPFIWIQLDKSEIYSKNGNNYLSTKFRVTDIDYNEHKEIKMLVIRDNSDHVRYVFGATKEKVYKPDTANTKAQQNTASKTSGSSTKKPGDTFTGADLDKAIKDMTFVKSREELEKVWASHPELWNNNEFRNITSDMGRTYPPKQK